MTATGKKRRGLMLVLSSPSGAGKTTLSRMLLESDPNVKMSISVTTRAPRPTEVDGVDYSFVDQVRFDEMVAGDELFEYATVFGNSYGTPRKPVEEALAAGRDVLFDIDWQGTQQLAQKAHGDLVSIFILPPSIAELERRLRNRAQDSEEVVRKRMAKATGEISHWREYDYVRVNHDPAECLGEIRIILNAERMRTDRQVGLLSLVQDLMRDGS